jgi:two-component system, OmpR family, sensor histidine kinase QseC
MMFSIRRFLLINLLLTLTVTTSLTALGDYYIDQQDIHSHLDMLLSHTAFAFAGLLTTQLDKNDFYQIQNGLNQISKSMEEVFKTGSSEEELLPSDYTNKYQLQVWDNQGHLVLHTANKTTILPLYNQPIGFSDKVINDVIWRIFTIKNSYGNLRIVVAEKYDIRTELAHRIAQDDVYIMLLTYPLSGLLIWLIIGKGLGSIKSVANEVSHRAPSHLAPVSTATVPIEIRPLVDELNHLFQRLQEAFDREKRFAGDAAHELRTPLAALKTQAEVALKTADFAEQRKILQNVVVGVDRCAHVVQQLLVLSRLVPEASALEGVVEFDLSKLAAEIIAQIGHLALEKYLDIELIAEAPAYIVGNPTAIGILIRNLVDNAIRYIPKKSTIDVVVENKVNGALLIVTDNGPGIPVELHDRVFERFYRILGNKSTGSGLGLAIVQQIAKLHNAHLSIGVPDSGQGLKIEVFFPRKK